MGVEDLVLDDGRLRVECIEGWRGCDWSFSMNEMLECMNGGNALFENN